MTEEVRPVRAVDISRCTATSDSSTRCGGACRAPRRRGLSATAARSPAAASRRRRAGIHGHRPRCRDRPGNERIRSPMSRRRSRSTSRPRSLRRRTRVPPGLCRGPCGVLGNPPTTSRSEVSVTSRTSWSSIRTEPFLNVVHPRDERENRRLAGTGRAYKRHELTVLSAERHVEQSNLAAPVSLSRTAPTQRRERHPLLPSVIGKVTLVNSTLAAPCFTSSGNRVGSPRSRCRSSTSKTRSKDPGRHDVDFQHVDSDLSGP